MIPEKKLVALGVSTVVIGLGMVSAQPLEVGADDVPTSSTIEGLRMQDQVEVQGNEVPMLFSADAPELGWRVINDTVMGGVSSGTWRFKPSGAFEFSGALSLQNNGGFASVRSDAADFGLSEVEGFALRVKGDGRTYQLRFYTSGQWDGVAYAQSFPTIAGEWSDVVLPFKGFLPTWRGREVSDAPTLLPENIRQVTLMIADKVEGPFSLEVESVRALRKSN